MRTRNRKNRKDRGAAFVELAIVVPLLAGLLLGMLEFGSAWRESALLTRLTSQAARTVSQLGTNPNADRQALTTIVATIQSTDRLSFAPGSTDRVVIYNATGATAPPPLCLTTTADQVPGVCNIYRADSTDPTKMFAAIDGYDSSQLYKASECATRFDGWCGDTRGWFTSNPNVDTPFVGVYVQVSYTPITGFTGTQTLTANSIYQIEPCTVINDEIETRKLCQI